MRSTITIIAIISLMATSASAQHGWELDLGSALAVGEEAGLDILAVIEPGPAHLYPRGGRKFAKYIVDEPGAVQSLEDFGEDFVLTELYAPGMDQSDDHQSMNRQEIKDFLEAYGDTSESTIVLMTPRAVVYGAVRVGPHLTDTLERLGTAVQQRDRYLRQREQLLDDDAGSQDLFDMLASVATGGFQDFALSLAGQPESTLMQTAEKAAVIDVGEVKRAAIEKLAQRQHLRQHEPVGPGVRTKKTATPELSGSVGGDIASQI